MFRSFTMSIASVSVCALVPIAHAQTGTSQTVPINEKCPIGKEPIVPGAGTVEHDGSTIGLCCPGCGEPFLAWSEDRKDSFVNLSIAGRNADHNHHGETGRAGSLDDVKQYGHMRDVMRRGQTQARIGLADLTSIHNLIAVGALEGLAGEITILDGDVWVTRVSDGEPQTSGPNVLSGDDATLLTAASVSRWESREAQGNGQGLASVVRSEALAAGIDLEVPFAFTIQPEAVDLSVHVINGYCPTGQNAQQSGAAPWRWSGADVESVQIVGFFAQGRGGEMTHHGTDIHAHAIVANDGRIVTGHIDEATLSGSVAIRFPADRLAGRIAGGVASGFSGPAPGPSYPYTLTDCPIGGALGSMGDPIVKMYDGREVRFCCAGCIGEFEADAAKHWGEIDAKIVEQQLVHYPIDTCIVTGKKLGENAVNHVHNNRLVRLASEGAVAEFKADPAKHLRALDKKIVDEQLADYPMDNCPVGGPLGSMGEPVNFIYMNRLVRFCCGGCEKSLVSEPAKYMAKLDAAYADRQRDEYALDTCVVSGAALGSMGDPVELVAGTKLVRFCCDGCFPKFRQNPSEYLSKLPQN